MTFVPLRKHPRKGEILAAIPALAFKVLSRSREGGKDWAPMVDLRAVTRAYEAMAMGHIRDGLKTAILNDSHLITYSMGSPWYAPRQFFLIEQFFIRIAPGPTDLAFAALDDLAKEEEADAIVMATAFAPNDADLAATYARYGYSQQSTQHIKQLR